MSAFRQKCIAFCIPRISERIRGYFTAMHDISHFYLLTYFKQAVILTSVSPPCAVFVSVYRACPGCVTTRPLSQRGAGNIPAAQTPCQGDSQHADPDIVAGHSVVDAPLLHKHRQNHLNMLIKSSTSTNDVHQHCMPPPATSCFQLILLH